MMQKLVLIQFNKCVKNSSNMKKTCLSISSSTEDNSVIIQINSVKWLLNHSMLQNSSIMKWIVCTEVIIQLMHVWISLH